ncbi:GNAT family N-acetyltransferase [Robertkochia solimangrovi]|uniref:GNAT family N-acetyltransferase n=1 Tax=Robertkochia solimangrovi TaxID=2213046 RepID=UPI00118079DF|nr:GNAT family N-acetyltransferase [Robertkochia solimangrovi]TRZ42533.1 GNAT family N-acetyltransferase [Robertkochia solimangrovi]
MSKEAKSLNYQPDVVPDIQNLRNCLLDELNSFFENLKDQPLQMTHLNNDEIGKLTKRHGNIRIISDRVSWNAFLSHMNRYDAYHTYDYHLATKRKDQEPILVAYENDDIKIGFPLLVSKIFDTPYFDATSAYGYVGPLSNLAVEPENFYLEDYALCFREFFKKNKIIAVFSRLNPYIPTQDNILKYFGELVEKGKIVNIDITLSDQEQTGQYHNRLRTYINSARKKCEIRLCQSEQDLADFMAIYHSNMDRVNANSYYYFNKEYFKNLNTCKDFEIRSLIAVEKDSETVIGGCIFLIKNGIVQYHLGGTHQDYLHWSPIKLLLDEMRILATQEGLEYYNLGGGLGGRYTDNLFKFKSSFSKDHKIFKIWKLVTDQDTYDSLVNKYQSSNEDFFPKYRNPEDK